MILFFPHFLSALYWLLLLLAPLPFTFALFNRLCMGQSGVYPRAGFWVGGLVGWLALHTLFALLLGNFGVLTQQGVFIAEIILFFVGVFWLIRTLPAHFWYAELRRLWNAPQDKLLCLGWMSIALVGFTLWMQISNTPITDFDSRFYHLPMIVNWIQTGQLTRLPGFGQIHFYPYNFELVAALFFFPFQRDYQAAFPNLVLWAVWVGAIYGLARENRAHPLSALTTAGLAGLLPIVTDQVNTLHVDLVFAALFVASLYFTHHFIRSFHRLSLLLAGVCMSLMPGIKMSAVGYILLIAAGGMLWFWRAHPTEWTGKLRRAVQRIRQQSIGWIIALLCLSVIAGSWYVRNMLEVGNPLGLLTFKVGPVTVLHGSNTFDDYLNTIYPHFSELKDFVARTYGQPASFDALVQHTSLLNVFHVNQPADWQTLGQQIWQNGQLPLALLGVGALLSLARLLNKRKVQGEIAILLILLTGCLLLYWITPYSGDNGNQGWKITAWVGQGLRYALSSYGLLAVIAALGISGFGRWADRIMLAGLLLLSVWFALSPLSVASSLFVISLGLVWVAYNLLRDQRMRLSVAGLGLLLLLATCGVSLPNGIQHYQAQQAAFFNGLDSFLLQNTHPGENIGYLTSYFSYPLATSHLDRVVNYVPTLGDDPQAWLQDLRNQDIQWVAVGPFGDPIWQTTREYRWLEDPTFPFQRVFGNDPVHEFVLYQLRSVP